MSACYPTRDVFCSGLNIENINWSLDPDDELQLMADRRTDLVSSLERNGIGSGTHLQALSLEQLEDMHRMLESYDEKHLHSSSDDDSESSFPLEVICKLLESEKLWHPIQIPACISCYDLNNATTT